MEIQVLTICLSSFLVFLGIAFARLSLHYIRSAAKLPENSLPGWVESLFDRPISSDSQAGSSGIESTKEVEEYASIRAWYIDFWQGISTEMIGAVITTILLSVVVGVVQQAGDRENNRKSLIRNMGSSDNGFALQAVDRLREEGWLFDGSLVDANLTAANLRNADLSFANLESVNLRFADLRGSNLFQANLETADLRYALLQEVDTRDFFDVDDARQALRARVFDIDFVTMSQIPTNFAGIAMLQAWAYSTRANLSSADLRFADLSGSDLSFSDLTNAILLDANFKGANLFMANVTGAIVQEDFVSVALGLDSVSNVGNPPIFDTWSLLPNGRRWNNQFDVNRFVDVLAPNFIDISECWAFVQSQDIQDTNPPLYCGRISFVIPYPERKLGPFRE